jgi:hypothetical protein
MAEPTELVVEVHIPMTPSKDVAEGEYAFPWIDDVMEYLVELEEAGEVLIYDDGEEWGDYYVFFLTGSSEADLLATAVAIAERQGVPSGVYAMVTDSEAEAFGMGRRVDLT